MAPKRYGNRPTRAFNRSTAVLPILLCLLGFVSLTGCGGGAGGGGGSGSPTSVTGTLEDSAKSDAPIAGATVKIGNAAALTASDGTFTINNAPVGANTAIITVVGGTPLTVGFSPSIGNGANSALQLFINIGEISGKILLPNGSPAVGAFVSNQVDGDIVSTASDGSFLFTEVPIGPTVLAAVLGAASATQNVTAINGLANIGSITLVNSTDPNPPGQPYDITGQVVLGGAGGPGAVSGTSVFILLNGTQLEVTTTDANGDYNFYVPVGSYTLKFSRDSYQDGSASVTISKPSTLTTIPPVTLQPD